MGDGNDILDELDERTEEPGFSGGDYADWWEPDEAGDELIGVIVEQHSAPADWTDPGEVPDTISTVLSIGRGDKEEGQLFTPKQHKQLKAALRDSGIEDLVKLKFTGYEQVQGNLSYTYEGAVIPKEEWEQMAGAEQFEELVEEHRKAGGIYGDNTRDAPYNQSGGGSSGGSGSVSGDGELAEAGDALEDFIGIQGGSASVEQVEKFVTDVRDFDVDVDDAIEAAGLERDGDTVSN